MKNIKRQIMWKTFYQKMKKKFAPYLTLPLPYTFIHKKIFIMVKNLIELSLIVIFATIVLILSTSCCETNSHICLVMKPSSCLGQDLTGTLLHVSELQEEKVYVNPADGSTQTFPDVNHYAEFYQRRGELIHTTSAVVDNSTATNRYIEGYEINYGFWSKDSYRKYSYRELFIKRFGREPTQTELDNMTCQDAEQWFKDIHTVHRGLFGDDPPRDVNCVSQPYTKFCFDMNYDRYTIDGVLEFPNGAKCQIKRLKLFSSDYDPCENPHNVEIEASKDCTECQ